MTLLASVVDIAFGFCCAQIAFFDGGPGWIVGALVCVWLGSMLYADWRVEQ